MSKNITLTILLFVASIATGFAQESSKDFLLKNRYLNTNSYANLQQHLAHPKPISLVQKSKPSNLLRLSSFQNLKSKDKEKVKFNLKGSLIGLSAGVLGGVLVGYIASQDGGHPRSFYTSIWGFLIGSGGLAVGFTADIVSFIVRKHKRNKALKGTHSYLHH